MHTLIDDADDTRLDDYRDLADPPARARREREEIFVAEGVAAIERLLESDHVVRSVLVTQAKFERLLPALQAAGARAPVYIASLEVLMETVGFKLHRGAVAVAERSPLPTVDEVLANDPRRLAVLEGLNDPENLGAIARSARALGIDALVVDPTCIDPYYRRAVRVSMGEILTMPVTRDLEWPAALDRVAAAGFDTWALTPGDSAESLWDAADGELDRVAIVLGAEGPGLSPQALAACRRRIRIPIDPAVDSLNVGHAAAVAFAAVSPGRG